MTLLGKWNWIKGKGTKGTERYYFYYPVPGRQNMKFRDRADYYVAKRFFSAYFTIENDFAPDASQLQKDAARFLKQKLHPSKYLFVATPTGLAKHNRKGKYLTVIQYYAIVDNLPPEEFVSGLRQDLAALAVPQEEVEGRKKSQVIDFNPWATGSRC